MTLWTLQFLEHNGMAMRHLSIMVRDSVTTTKSERDCEENEIR
jgi:hypothetical protein